jgi:hypothetical protein
MRPGPIEYLRFAFTCLALAIGTFTPVAEAAASQEASAAEVMQSVFANRVRDGGFWRQDNEAYEEGSDAPKYWMQVWRYGPGAAVVIVDAYAVGANDCSTLMHIVYSYDPATGGIRSNAFGLNGISGHGVVDFEGTVTRGEATILLPGGREIRMRDREDQGGAEEVVVEAETWDGEAWNPGSPATWRRSMEGLPCAGSGVHGTEP